MEPPIRHSTSNSVVLSAPSVWAGNISAGQGFIERFTELRRRSLKAKPRLGKIFEEHGHKSLAAYLHSIRVPGRAPSSLRSEFVSAIRSEAQEHFDAGVTDRIGRQIEEKYSLCTADHHGPLHHSWFVHTHLAQAATEHNSSGAQKDILVLSCSNVSMHNPSFPRGISFHARAPRDGMVRLHTLSLFPRNANGFMVFGYRPYGTPAIVALHALLQEKVRDGMVEARIAECLHSLVDEIYGSPGALAASSYADQIVRTNTLLWRKFFGHSCNDVPDCYFFEQEKIVTRLLLAHHLQGNTSLHRFLFASEGDPLRVFEGIEGAFSTQSKRGTYLFWAIPPGQKYRMALWRDGDKLVSEDCSYSVTFSPDALGEALLRKEILPGTLLDFLVLAMTYGVHCQGGASQIHYLEAMRQAYRAVQCSRGEEESVRLCDTLITGSLCVDYNCVFLGDGNALLPATGIDLTLYGEGDLLKHVEHSIQSLTLEQAIAPEFPAYFASTPQQEEQMALQLSTITADDILNDPALRPSVSPFAIL